MLTRLQTVVGVRDGLVLTWAYPRSVLCHSSGFAYLVVLILLVFFFDTEVAVGLYLHCGLTAW